MKTFRLIVTIINGHLEKATFTVCPRLTSIHISTYFLNIQLFKVIVTKLCGNRMHKLQIKVHLSICWHDKMNISNRVISTAVDEEKHSLIDFFLSKWHFIQDSYVFIRENAFDNVVCQTALINTMQFHINKSLSYYHPNQPAKSISQKRLNAPSLIHDKSVGIICSAWQLALGDVRALSASGPPFTNMV